ncbi:Unknown protein, partial [Striga hermonthica]
FRSQPCVFLGYNSKYKGYKVLLPNRKVIITRNVLFDEKVFPYQTKHLTATTSPTSPQITLSAPPIIVHRSTSNKTTPPSPLSSHLHTPSSNNYSSHSSSSSHTVPIHDAQNLLIIYPLKIMFLLLLTNMQ